MERCVRWAKREEWEEAMDLVWKTFMSFNSHDCSPEGVASFREFITDEKLKETFYEGRYEMMVATEDGKVIGVGSLRNVNHLSLLFVDAEHQKQGVGRALLSAICEYLKLEVGEHRISLTASPSAVGFYKKLGFMRVSSRMVPPGIPVVSMEKVF